MLDRLYRLGRILMSQGWIVGLLLIAFTVVYGTIGFLQSPVEGTHPSTLWDALYRAISLLAIQTGAVSTEGNGLLEAARWTGMLFWASALIAVAVRLFRESVHRLLVKAFARNHVIVAGLGQQGARLVEALRAQGRTVVVIEPDRNHPAVELCHRLGAIVLFGEPDETPMLLAANLPTASVVLALFLEERDCVRTTTAAYRILHERKATSRERPVRCVLRVTEPGLLDVFRSHKIKTDETDRFELEILNAHEIAATTMVREATANSSEGAVKRVMVLGLGTHHRLGEMVVLRLVKDHHITHNGPADDRLQIDIFDRQAAEWLDVFRSRHPDVSAYCELTAQPCWARKVGASALARDYDAAFVCIADEGHAVAQAVMLRRSVLTRGQPIMVRVRDSRSGHGALIGDPESGWGENMHPVGLEDSLVDPDSATRPEIEMRAQTIHHEYRRQKREDFRRADTPEKAAAILNLSANRPWTFLSEGDRAQNRQLAEKYDEYLRMVLPAKATRYRRVFLPSAFGHTLLPVPFSLIEVDALAEVEHTRWLAQKRAQGFTLGEDRARMQNPFIKEWVELSDEQKSSTRTLVRDIAKVLALADYAVVPDEPDGVAS